MLFLWLLAHNCNERPWIISYSEIKMKQVRAGGGTQPHIFNNNQSDQDQVCCFCFLCFNEPLKPLLKRSLRWKWLMFNLLSLQFCILKAPTADTIVTTSLWTNNWDAPVEEKRGSEKLFGRHLVRKTHIKWLRSSFPSFSLTILCVYS